MNISVQWESCCLQRILMTIKLDWNSCVFSVSNINGTFPTDSKRHRSTEQSNSLICALFVTSETKWIKGKDRFDNRGESVSTHIPLFSSPPFTTMWASSSCSWAWRLSSRRLEDRSWLSTCRPEQIQGNIVSGSEKKLQFCILFLVWKQQYINQAGIMKCWTTCWHQHAQKRHKKQLKQLYTTCSVKWTLYTIKSVVFRCWYNNSYFYIDFLFDFYNINIKQHKKWTLVESSQFINILLLPL